MAIERWRQIEHLFHAAHEKTAEERTRFLDETCSSDPTLRREVESLLANEVLAASFLESDRAEPSPEPAAREPVHPGERIGPYTVTELLGAGGMGEVYKAHDKRLDRHVAIKFLPRVKANDSEALARFEREARAASALNHPNICTVHDVGEFQGRSFIVMELLEGQSLKDRIAGKPVPLPEFAAVSRQVCAALEAAHAKGIVHRDVKPGNIFVAHGGQVKILDFGLAKRGAQSISISSATTRSALSTCALTLTSTGTIMGTLAYMSPEQSLGEDVDARSDVFSFGAVLYEMATGRPPFRGKTPAGIIGSILSEAPVKPSALNAAIPAKLEQVIFRALEKDREVRYQSAALLSTDLEKWQQSRAATATLRTRRWMLGAVGAGAASLAGGAFLARRSIFPPQGRIMIAVLPFENIGGNPQDAFLADGLHQDMISVLNRLYPDRLGVIARTSVKRYQATGTTIEQIGRDLNVGYVVEGGVQREGDQAHVTARLVRVTDQTPLWSATYNRELGQILAAQAEIAQAIAQGIERGLRPNAQVSAALAQPLNASAHEAYLRGDYAKAVELDPGYAAAYSGLANKLYYPGLFGFRPPGQAFTGMMNAASKALELDATQASAHASLALSKLHLQRSWSEAEEGFRRALRLDPGDAEVRHFFAHLLLWSGREKESARECERALQIDPFNPTLFSCIGWHELLTGDVDKALEQTRRALALQQNHWWALMIMGWAYEEKGMFQEALAAFRKSSDSNLKTASIAHAFARSGNRSGARTILDDLLAASKTKYVSPYDIAVIYTGLDDKVRTLEWLNRAYEEHSGFLVFVKQDPRFRIMRRDPSFQDLLRRMGFPNQQT
jgi:TolB-like protein/Flp pilus assembly protein TadD/predicted Ser/Thr protein kinase